MRRIASSTSAGANYGYLGVTLVELMLAVALFGVIAMIAVPVYGNYIDKMNQRKAVANIRAIEYALNDYRLEWQSLPPSLNSVGMGTLLDPWGNPYQYLDVSGAKSKAGARKDHKLVPINSDFDLYSMGKDGRTAAPLTAADSRDDIVRANDGAFIGLAADY